MLCKKFYLQIILFITYCRLKINNRFKVFIVVNGYGIAFSLQRAQGRNAQDLQTFIHPSQTNCRQVPTRLSLP